MAQLQPQAEVVVEVEVVKRVWAVGLATQLLA
jgi:hypothetical protein